MTERHLTFAEVQEILGLSPDGVRELMESKSLRGEIIDGVIRFEETQVMRLRGAHGDALGQEDMGLVFLVDEEEEEQIEGKAYDGEDLLTRKEAVSPAPDEELMEPVELSEDQRRNAELLGTDDVVAFGREVSERTREEEFGTSQLADDEEIIEPADVELPEPEFGPLAAAVPEAQREEPAEAAPEPEEPEPEVTAVGSEEEAPEDVVPVEENVPLEPLLTGAVAPGEEESVEFMLDSEPAPAAEEPPELKVVEPLVPGASGLTFEEVEAEPLDEAAVEQVEAVAAADETDALQFEEETPEPEEAESLPAAEGAPETFEVTAPEPQRAGVTDELELAVDEELADLEPEPVEEVVPEQASAVEAPSEPEPVVEAASEPEPVAQEPVAEPEPEPVADEPAPVAGAVIGAAAADDVWEELQEKPSVDQGVPEAVTPVAAESDRQDEPVASESEAPRQTEADEIPEEAEQVTEEHREEEEAFKSEEELIPLEEGTEEPAPVEPAPADTFDLAEPDESIPIEEIEVTDLEDAPSEGEAEEDLMVLEEEAPPEEAVFDAGGPKTLEEEVAELFDEEPAQASPDEALAAAPAAAEEDFDLSVFQQGETATEEALPTVDESLFEEVGAGVSAEEEQPVEMAQAEVEGVSRIRALTEERAAPNTAAITAAILLAFAAVAFTGMLLWHLFNTG